uniref:Nuclear pore complex protein Nup88 n=1 Tax=Romanomermis culicivorax TaxID=13658 RepID=A0A915JUH4_ROMCU
MTKMPDSLTKALNDSYHIQKSKKVDQTAFGADDDSVVYQLFTCYGGVLFAWTDRGLLAFVNIAPRVGTNDALFNVSTYIPNVTLHLTKIPFGRVVRLEMNNTGTHLALMCKSYCYVVEIPPIFRIFKSLNDIDSEYLCKCYDVNACEYESNNSAYLCVRWMPDFSGSRFLLTLRSDNSLRIYKIDYSSCNIIDSVFCNGDSAKFTSNIMSTLSNLGETAVSFDIAPCRNCTSNISRAPMYTVFVLHGNGDVYSIILDAFGCRKSISGPLIMHPPAEDNYGLDSCDLIAISSSKHEEAFTCLIIATSYGNLYHCIVQSDNLEGEDDDFSLDSQFSLFVYENVELEFSLSTIDLEKKTVKECTFLSTVFLCKDSFASDIYHCTHSSGIHSIHLQWLRELEIYNKESGDSSDELLTGYDQACIVKYRLCTTLGPSERRSSVKGFATMFESPLKNLLLILLPNFNLEIIQPSGTPISRAANSSLTPLAQKIY